MALPTYAVMNAAVNALHTLAKERALKSGSRFVVSNLSRMIDFVKREYTPLLSIDLTDATDAGVAEAIASDGELGVAAIAAGIGGSFPVGGIFKIAGTTEDFTDNALATAKGSAVAANDVFQVSGADAVTYLGNDSGGPLLFTDNEMVDLVWPA